MVVPSTVRREIGSQPRLAIPEALDQEVADMGFVIWGLIIYGLWRAYKKYRNSQRNNVMDEIDRLNRKK